MILGLDMGGNHYASLPIVRDNKGAAGVAYTRCSIVDSCCSDALAERAGLG